MESEFRISTGQHDGVPVLEVSGEIDLGLAGDAFKKALLGLDEGPSGSFVVVDLSNVTFLDSTGLSALVIAEKYLRRQGRKLRLVVSHPAVRRVLAVTSLDEVFAVFPTLSEATAQGAVRTAV